MKRAIKGFVVMAAVVAMVGASPALARCLFGSPIFQGGQGGGAPGGIVSATDGVTGGIVGLFWSIGSGDPADGAGNDQGLRDDRDGFVDGDIILRDAALPRVSFDWFNTDVDGCLTDAAVDAPGDGAMAIFLLDDAGDYGVMAVTGVDLGSDAARHDFDDINSGIGANANDIELVALSLAPVLSNVVIVDSSSITADIAPASAGINFHDDGNGPYDLFDTSSISGACPTDGGCSGITITRDADLCYTGDAEVVGSLVPGAQACDCGGIMACLNYCGGLCGGCCTNTGGTCVSDPPTVLSMATIPGGCVTIGGPVVDDHAFFRAAVKQKGFTVFSWDATQFAVSHWNILDVTKGERRINQDVIARKGGNDGSTVTYEFVATGRDVRGGKSFELELIRTDGQSIRFAVQ